MFVAFDMDGTIANLYGYPDWLGYLRGQDATPYRYCTPTDSAETIRNALQTLMNAGIDVYILSWNCGGDWPSREYRKQVVAAKRAWLHHYGIPYTRLRVVGNGTPKSSVIPGSGVLFDDEVRNREEWERSGKGRAFDPSQIVDVVRQIVENL